MRMLNVYMYLTVYLRDCVCPQGILFTTPECIKTPVDFVKLWLHEASRVYGDKLIETKDMEQFQNIKADIARTAFEVSALLYCTVALSATSSSP